ncbi:MAG TPA: GGDEF domain-containing protein [Acidimicrobiales bacterium]|nr:GGDEF domain-containing protein [Acidimicrobiales bacterium]
MPPPLGHIDRRRQLLTDWEQACRARALPDAADHCNGADAMFLVSALVSAIRQGGATPELGRAARTWGARFSTPVAALAALSALRDAFLGGVGSGEGDDLALVSRIVDQASMDAVEAASGNLRSAARKDPLTGCSNRRALEEDLSQAVVGARRSGLDLAVAVVDLDGLKTINDSEGHAAGDAALVGLVATMREALREADGLYRTGGDEFVVVAPFTEPAGARALMRRAERMGGPSFSWGVSSLAELGLASSPGTGNDGSAEGAALLEAADADLYERRRAGRRAATAAIRRRRATRVASVAASVAVTTGVAGLAVALERGSVAANADRASAEVGGNPNGAPEWPALAQPVGDNATTIDLVQGPPPPSALSVEYSAPRAGAPSFLQTWLAMLSPSLLGDGGLAVPSITAAVPGVSVPLPVSTLPVVTLTRTPVVTADLPGPVTTTAGTTPTGTVVQTGGTSTSTTTSTKGTTTTTKGTTTTTTKPNRPTATTTTSPEPTTTTTTPSHRPGNGDGNSSSNGNGNLGGLGSNNGPYQVAAAPNTTTTTQPHGKGSGDTKG